MRNIAEALVTTAVGLVVAIPAVAAFNWFQRTVKVTLSNTDALGHVLLAYLRSKEVEGGRDEKPRESKEPVSTGKKPAAKPAPAAEEASGESA
jgi:biopolymer transport protein ExbB